MLFINSLVFGRGSLMKIVTVGIDLTKNVFAVHGVDEAGHAQRQAQTRPGEPLGTQLGRTTWLLAGHCGHSGQERPHALANTGPTWFRLARFQGGSEFAWELRCISIACGKCLEALFLNTPVPIELLRSVNDQDFSSPLSPGRKSRKTLICCCLRVA